MPAASQREPNAAARGPVPGWRWRSHAALALFALVLAVPVPGPWNSRLVLAYALAISVFAAITCWGVSRPRREEMQAFVRQHERPGWAPLVGAGLLSIISLAALVYLLRTVTHQPPGVKGFHLMVSLYAVLVTWAVLHTAFALRYAALYYAPAPGQPERPAGGLSFPDPDLTPDYWDFLYYAFVIGMCYQTSDVSVVRADVRRYTLLHSVFAYLYGVGILSLLVGAVGGAF